MDDRLPPETITDLATGEIARGAPAAELEKTPALSHHDHKMLDKDIKYRGPFSYRHLRLFAWIALALTFISMMMGMVLNVKNVLGEPGAEALSRLETVSNIFSYFSALPLPLFLLANITNILQEKNDYKKLLLKYGKILLIIYVGFIFVYYHYIVILLMRVENISFVEARELSIDLFTLIGKQNGLVVNVFVDLFCCVLIMYFIDYTPKKYFQGKKIILFRLLVLLPILYEIGSAVLMGLMGINGLSYTFTFSVPAEILPLIGKKPIGMIVAFIVICLYVKIREKLYMKRGGTREGYELYLQTNRNSFRFSLMLSVTFLIIAIIDFIVLLAAIMIAGGANVAGEELNMWMEVFMSFTLGKSVCLIMIIPFVLLFSYTRTHSNPKLDRLLPFIGIGLIIFAVIETVFFTVLF